MAKRVNDAGIAVFDCVVCGVESIFPLCSDCQIDLGKPLPEIQSDWERHLATLVEEGGTTSEPARGVGPGDV